MARSVMEVGDGRMDWAVVFAPRIRLAILERTRLVLDTRFVPPSPEPANTNPCLYLLLRGRWHGGQAPPIEAPSAFVLSEEHLEGGDGARAFTYRTDERTFAAIEVHLAAEDTVLRPGPAPLHVPLDERTWRAAMRVAALKEHDDQSMAGAVTALLEALAAQDVLRAEVVESTARAPSAAFALLWKALRPRAELLDLLPTVQQISGTIGASPRDVDRYVRAFVTASGLVGTGWRPASRHLRLKMAVIMLSAERTSVAEVARVVGYGSADAMARAFRDADLPSPSAVRDAVRAST